MSLPRPPFTASPIQVWAVEDRAVQVIWGHLPEGPITLEARRTGGGINPPIGHVAEHHPGGPGLLELQALPPSTDLTLHLSWRGGDRTLTARTDDPTPGAELFRFATISDVHLGAVHWGFLKTMIDRQAHLHPDPYPLRCARAALNEASAWGAQLVVIKGDLVQHRNPANFAQAGALVDEFPDLPMLLIPGNHDVDLVESDMTLPLLGRRQLAYTQGAAGEDVAGARIIVADSTTPGAGAGTLEPCHEQIVDLARCDRPAFVAVHHHFQRYGTMTHWPPGIDKAEADRFFPELRRANPRSLVTSGHSHRNRRRLHHGVTFSEVGSTKDWPGVWGGYVVHEGGIRQTVRKTRTMIEWHEYSRGAVFGVWGLWSPGRPDERCFSLNWD